MLKSGGASSSHLLFFDDRSPPGNDWVRKADRRLDLSSPDRSTEQPASARQPPARRIQDRDEPPEVIDDHWISGLSRHGTARCRLLTKPVDDQTGQTDRAAMMPPGRRGVVVNHRRPTPPDSGMPLNSSAPPPTSTPCRRPTRMPVNVSGSGGHHDDRGSPRCGRRQRRQTRLDERHRRGTETAAVVIRRRQRGQCQQRDLGHSSVAKDHQQEEVGQRRRPRNVSHGSSRRRSRVTEYRQATFYPRPPMPHRGTGAASDVPPK